MTSEDSSYVVDPWSRFVSYCSLVVAVCALAWVLFGFGTFSNWGDSSTGKSLDSATIEARYDKEVEERNKRDEGIRNEWKQQYGEQLTAFTVAANQLLRQQQRLVSQNGGLADASYTALTAGNESDATNGDDGADGETDIDNDDEIPLIPITPFEGVAADNREPPGAQDQLFQPLLAHVHETLRPGTDTNTSLLTVRNRGGSPAVLKRVEFTPSFEDESIFEVAPSASALADDKNVLTIVFREKDNLASAAGKHGVYAREFSDVHAVPAASAVRIRLAAANSKHVGWGFRGTVKLEYNGLEPLTIEDAQLIFVAADDNVRRE